MPRSGDITVPSAASRAPRAPAGSNPLRDPGVGSQSAGSASAAPARSADAGNRFASSSDAGRRSDGTYVIQPKDNYWSISEKLFGTGAYFQALAKANAKKFPSEDKLKAGDVILAPTSTELERSYPELCPSPARRNANENAPRTVNVPSRPGGNRVYVVQQGDTVYDIARRELGKPLRWSEIYELNKDTLGRQSLDLVPGTQLLLPDESPAAVTQRNDSAPRR